MTKIITLKKFFNGYIANSKTDKKKLNACGLYSTSFFSSYLVATHIEKYGYTLKIKG